HLRLYIHRERAPRHMGWAPDDQELVEPRARLTFRYGELAVGAFDPREVVPGVADGKLRRVRRDPIVEEKCIERLSELDIFPLHDVDDTRIEENAAGDLVLGIDEDDTQEFLLRFATDEIPKLRADGWQVEMDANYPYRVVEGEIAWYAEVNPGRGEAGGSLATEEPPPGRARKGMSSGPGNALSEASGILAGGTAPPGKARHGLGSGPGTPRSG